MTYADDSAPLAGAGWSDPDIAVRTPGGAAVTTYVSLFLLLFVFFIVLFSIAQVRRDRSLAVEGSIDQAFGRLPSRLGILPPPPAQPNDGATPGNETFAHDASALLLRFGAFEIDRAAAGGNVVLAADIALSGLFQPGGTALRPAAAPLIDRLAVLLQRRDDGHRYRLVWHVVLPAGAAETTPGARLAVARGGAVAAALFARGCPADGVAVTVERGMQPAADPAIRLDFTRIDRAASGQAVDSSP